MSIYENSFYYSFEELLEKALNSSSSDSLNALGEWCQTYMTSVWNGECYDISTKDHPGLELFPVYNWESPEDSDEYGEIIGWEIR